MKYRVLELFAGIGAWARAFERLNIPHEIVDIVEFDKKTVDCYNVIHGSSFIPKDITKLTGNDIPDCDIICYSPPCQAFSIAGKQLGFDDQRGVLFFAALRIIKAKKPKYCLMENVKGLVGKKFQSEFQRMLKELENAGYHNYWKVLNAKDYGVPQNRERVFVISIRKDIDNGKFEFPKPFDNGLRLKDILESEVDEKFYISQEICMPVSTLTSQDRHGILQIGMLDMKGNEQIRRVYSSEGLSPTLNTCGGGNTQPKVYSDYRIRKLIPLEYIRLMGFSDIDYQNLKANKISNTQIYKVCGNSIVVNVVEKILQSLLH